MQVPRSPHSIAAEPSGQYVYVVNAAFDRVVLLEERGRRWWPLADANFGPPAVVGRGGLATAIIEGRLLAPDALALVGDHATAPEVLVEDLVPGGTREHRSPPIASAPAFPAPAVPGPERIVLTGRREGQLAGVATAWRGPQVDGPVHAGVVVEAGSRRQGVGRVLLMALEAAMRQHGWSPERVLGHGPAGFYAACSAWVQAAEPLVGPGG